MNLPNALTLARIFLVPIVVVVLLTVEIRIRAFWGASLFLVLKIAPAWMVVIILGREFAVSGLRSIAAHEGFAINVSTLGKGKMVTQVAAVVGLILGQKYHGWVQLTANLLLWAVVFFALVSMVQYFREFWSKLDSSIKYRERRRQKILIRRRKLAADRRELDRLRELERMRKQELKPPATG
ncbi:MAG: CDP-diacylglycerol--glycerol-3-phosphate 3-phosphatidyltransferase [Acidobacteria bacterium]|nr:CDP-diacylglycerol--glycerol-3-phosphate 3-phosphatidyltransferase [Acidobacteriota bacterium]